MRHPHPLLARIALAALAAAAGTAVNWISQYLLTPIYGGAALETLPERWNRLLSLPAGATGLVLYEVEWVWGRLIPVVALAVAAGLLRRAATGRLAQLAAPVYGRPAVAVAVMGLAAVYMAVSVYLWAYPLFLGNYSLPERVVNNYSAPVILGAWATGGPPGTMVWSNDAYSPARRALDVVRIEAGQLFAAAQNGAILFCLTGAVYCLESQMPTDDT